MGVNERIRVPVMQAIDHGSQDGTEAVQMQVRSYSKDYEIIPLKVSHEYNRDMMQDRHKAAQTIAEMRAGMVHEIAKAIYEHMEFNDYEIPERWSVIMQGKIQILRRIQ